MDLYHAIDQGCSPAQTLASKLGGVYSAKVEASLVWNQLVRAIGELRSYGRLDANREDGDGLDHVEKKVSPNPCSPLHGPEYLAELAGWPCVDLDSRPASPNWNGRPSRPRKSRRGKNACSSLLLNP